MISFSVKAQTETKGQKAVDGSANDNFSCMVRTTDGGLLAGGSSYSNISGDKTENSRGDADYWIVKFDANGKKQAVENKIPFTVYPNPASTVLNIQLKGKSVFNITDRNGRTVITKAIESNGIIDVSRLKMSMYFISTPSGSKQQVIIGGN